MIVSEFQPRPRGRIRQLYIEPDVLLQMFTYKPDRKFQFSGIPADARFLAAAIDPQTNRIILSIESEHFDVVPVYAPQINVWPHHQAVTNHVPIIFNLPRRLI